MFQLLYDSPHNLLVSRFSGTYTIDDIVLRDRAVNEFVKAHGLARGLMDFTDITAIDIPMAKVIERCEAPPLLPGPPRIILAPTDLAWRFNKVVAAHQLYARKVAPLLLRSPAAAYRALGMETSPRFEPLEPPPESRDDIILRVLAEIDGAHGVPGRLDEERRRLRVKLLRLMEGRPERLDVDHESVAGRLYRRPNAITLSDVMNTVLSSATLIDADLKTACRQCGKRLTLGDCHIVAGRQTTYACPTCGTILVRLAPALQLAPLDRRGYLLGTFEVRTTTDIECVGALLPVTELQKAAEPPL